MTVRIGTAGEGVEIECADVETHPYVLGNLRLIVSVRTQDFIGRTDTGVEQPKWAAFMQQLRELEATRRGSATLEGIHPGELRLVLRSIDRAGHMTIDGFVGVRGPHREVKLEFSPIEFDAGDLPGILREFSKFTPVQFVRRSSS